MFVNKMHIHTVSTRKAETHHRRPDTRNGHFVPSLPSKIHGQPFRHNAYANFSNRIRRLPTKEARVYRRTDDDDPSFPALLAEVWERRGYRRVQTLRIDLLEQLEALDGRRLHGTPPDGARIVD